MNKILSQKRNLSIFILIMIFSGCGSSDTKKITDNTKSVVVKNFYVSASSSHSASGTLDNPFKTLSEARDVARKFKNITVKIYLRTGIYNLDKTFELTSLDSRTEENPLTISAFNDENVSIMGSKEIQNWKAVQESDEIYSLLSQEAHQHTLVSNLQEIGITNLTKPIVSTREYDSGENPTYANELFLNNARVAISKYPATSLLSFKYKDGILSYKNNTQEDITAINGWAKDTNLFTYGKWHYDWADERNQVLSIDTKNATLKLNSVHAYGYREESLVSQGIGFYGFNVASALHKGSYYIDYNNAKIYYWPKDAERSKTYLSSLESIISINNANYITIDGLTLQQSKKNAINIHGTSHITINHCDIREIGGIGIYADDANSTTIENSTFHELGAGGIQVNSGDRATLVSGKSIIDSNKVFNTALNVSYYTAGIKIYGVGTRVSNNYLYNLPHTAIYFNGNNHIIDGNTIHDVVLKSNDAGAIYAGKDWSQRGTVIQNNFIYNVIGERQGATGVYLDDLYCGTTVKDNIIHNVSRAILIGGGRDNIIDGNIFSNCATGVHADSRGTSWYQSDDEAKIHMGYILNKVPWKSDIWKAAYPNLFTIYETNPRLPIGNEIINNTIISERSWWKDFTQNSEEYIYLDNNQHIQERAKDISSFNSIHEFKDYLTGFRE